MELVPTAIERDGDAAIKICWSDGRELRYTASVLRSACPCATCREKHSATKAEKSPLMLPVLKAEEARPLTIRAMRPVGNYAYNIAFSDGHDSGIFTFDHLVSLG